MTESPSSEPSCEDARHAFDKKLLYWLESIKGLYEVISQADNLQFLNENDDLACRLKDMLGKAGQASGTVFLQR
jgi:hypothetical protein